MANTEFVESLKKVLRVKSENATEEIGDLIEACKKEMEIANVYIADETEPLCKQAIKLYCKSHYGYDSDSEKFHAAYESLRDSMALSGDYKKAGDVDGSEADLEI